MDYGEDNMEALNEKVSVNINSATLSGIDLLVDNGYYSNRSGFINQALGSALQQHQTTTDRIVVQHSDRLEQGKFPIYRGCGLAGGRCPQALCGVKDHWHRVAFLKCILIIGICTANKT